MFTFLVFLFDGINILLAKDMITDSSKYYTILSISMIVGGGGHPDRLGLRVEVRHQAHEGVETGCLCQEIAWEVYLLDYIIICGKWM